MLITGNVVGNERWNRCCCRTTPDYIHAPASLQVMEIGKAVYCQKPLIHHVSDAYAMIDMAKAKGLVTQMGIQVHSFYDYGLATQLI